VTLRPSHRAAAGQTADPPYLISSAGSATMKKGTLERIHQLPIRLQVDKEIYQDAVNFIAA
jgi:hypothetical protein